MELLNNEKEDWDTDPPQYVRCLADSYPDVFKSVATPSYTNVSSSERREEKEIVSEQKKQESHKREEIVSEQNKQESDRKQQIASLFGETLTKMFDLYMQINQP